MDRSRSKRSYYYDHDSDSPPPPRNKGRFGGGPHRRGPDRRPPPPPPPPPLPPSSSSKLHHLQDGPPQGAGQATTFYRILCPDSRAAFVAGRSGAAIKALRQETGAWISVLPLAPGDEEIVIETSDTSRREPDGRPPPYSPAQEALLLVHERILAADNEDDGDDYGGWERDRDRDRGGGRVTSRLVVPRMHVGCLMGKGGKIIEQMRMETKTHIRILPRDHNVPRCVSTSEEIVQVVGDANAVKKAVGVISSRLKESLHRDRGPPFRGRMQSSDRFSTFDDEFDPYESNIPAHPGGVEAGSRLPAVFDRARNSSFTSRSSGYHYDSEANPLSENDQVSPYEELVFRILCPNDKVKSVVGQSEGILDLLHKDVGVDVTVSDPVPDSDERVIVVSCDEVPDDDLFPTQEALLHIQTRIVDLGPDNDNIIKTRLVLSANEVECFEGKDGALSEIQRLTSANVRLLSKEDLPMCVFESDELLQIVGDIKAARNALLHITARLRSYIFRDMQSLKDPLLPSTTNQVVNNLGDGSTSPGKFVPRNGIQEGDTPSFQTAATVRQPKDASCGNGTLDQEESVSQEESRQSDLNSSPVIPKKTLEVIVPEHAVRSLTMKSGSKLALISDMSGATVSFVEDRLDVAQKIILITGSPEQADKAQSLLQGFILSTLDDAPPG